MDRPAPDPDPRAPAAGPSDAGPSDAGPSDAGPSDAGPARLRILDALWVFVASVVLSVLLGSVAAAVTGDTEGDGAVTTAFLLGGNAAGVLGGAAVVARRRGTGSLRRDLGLEVHGRDGWVLFLGLALQVVLALALFPLQELVDDDQGVVETLRDSTGAKLAVLAAYAVIVAPLAEEVLFRGLLLRALQRRFGATAAVVVSALVFGVVHWLLDPAAGTAVVVPALVVFGLVAGRFAVRSASLSRPILLHVGFNLLTVVLLLG
jgi:hypothetical protein